MRVVLGGVAAALALTLAPQPASANHLIACAEGFEPICHTFNRLEPGCIETKWTHC